MAQSKNMTRLLAVLLVCPVFAGCLHRAGSTCDCSAPAAAGSSCDLLPIVERGHIETDGETLPVVPPTAQGTLVYRALTAQQCQCLAVRNADTANLLDAERQGVAAQAAGSGFVRSHQEHGLFDVKQSILASAA